MFNVPLELFYIPNTQKLKKQIYIFEIIYLLWGKVSNQFKSSEKKVIPLQYAFIIGATNLGVTRCYIRKKFSILSPKMLVLNMRADHQVSLTNLSSAWISLKKSLAFQCHHSNILMEYFQNRYIIIFHIDIEITQTGFLHDTVCVILNWYLIIFHLLKPKFNLKRDAVFSFSFVRNFHLLFKVWNH